MLIIILISGDVYQEVMPGPQTVHLNPVWRPRHHLFSRFLNPKNISASKLNPYILFLTIVTLLCGLLSHCHSRHFTMRPQLFSGCSHHRLQKVGCTSTQIDYITLLCEMFKRSRNRFLPCDRLTSFWVHSLDFRPVSSFLCICSLCLFGCMFD